MSTTSSHVAPKILVVEANENLRMALADNLEDEGYDVLAVQTGRAALDAVQADSVDVVVLDIMLPDLDGYTICRTLREQGCTAGVLMLTARTLEDDIVKGFDVGADDYLAKPYRLRELLARVRALLRRGGTAPTTSLQLGAFVVDRQARQVCSSTGETVELTRTEFDLLVFMIEQRGKALSRELILDKVWGQQINVDPRTVDNFVSSLKRKLGWVPGCGFRFRSVRGVGYRLELDDA